MKPDEQYWQLLEDHDPEIEDLARAVHALMLDIRPDASLSFTASWGGFLSYKTGAEVGNSVCFLSSHSKHVSLGFAEGAELEDPSGLLQGKGKRQRHVKIKKPGDIEKPELRELIKAAWARQPEEAVLENSVENLREICLSLPETSEVISHGHPTFKVGKKSFAVYGIYSPSLAFKAGVEMHAQTEGDDRFFPTPYMAHIGWLSIRLDEKTDWKEVERLVRHSYLQVATKKQQKALRDLTG